MPKIYLFTTVVFLFMCNILVAQYNTKLYNKLHKELKNAKSDTTKIRVMAQLGDYHIEESYVKGLKKSMDTALHYAKKLEAFSKTIHSSYGLSETYLLKAKAFSIMSNHEKGAKFAQSAIEINSKSGNKKDLIRSHRTLLMENRYLKENEENIRQGEKIVELAKASGNNLEIARSYELLADFYEVKMDLPKTLYVLEQSLKYYKLAGEERVQNVYAFMATVYGTLGEQEKSLQAIFKSIALVEKFDDRTYYTSTVFSIAGKTYREMERYDEAEKYYKRAYQNSKRFDDDVFEVITAKSLISILILVKKEKDILPYLLEIEKKYDKIRSPYRELGIAVLLERYLEMNNLAKAEKYFKQAKETYANLEDTGAVQQQLFDGMALYYFKTKKYDLATQNVLKSKAISEKAKAKFRLKKNYEMLCKIDSAKGNYLSAMKYQNVINLYKDSLFNETKSKQLTQMQVQYDVEKKDKDNLLLKQQASLRDAKLSKATIVRNVSFLGILFLFLAIIMIYRRFRINQRIRKEIDHKNEILLHLIDEKECLLKEIHHRVKNNLQIVMSLLNTQSHFLNDAAAKQAIKNSQDRIHSISLIHKKLYQNENVASVNMELYIRELVEYFKASFDTKQRLRFLLEVEPIELDSSQAVPLGLILNEAVNNAIKHAFPDNREGQIEIKFHSFGENKMRLSIKDNGVGTNGDLNNENFSSFGIKLIKGFSCELKAKLNFINKYGITVYLELPYNRNLPGKFIK